MSQLQHIEFVLAARYLVQLDAWIEGGRKGPEPTARAVAEIPVSLLDRGFTIVELGGKRTELNYHRVTNIEMRGRSVIAYVEPNLLSTLHNTDAKLRSVLRNGWAYDRSDKVVIADRP